MRWQWRSRRRSSRRGRGSVSKNCDDSSRATQRCMWLSVIPTIFDEDSIQWLLSIQPSEERRPQRIIVIMLCLRGNQNLSLVPRCKPREPLHRNKSNKPMRYATTTEATSCRAQRTHTTSERACQKQNGKPNKRAVSDVGNVTNWHIKKMRYSNISLNTMYSISRYGAGHTDT